MMENKMAWQEGYEHGYAAAMEHFNEACEQEYKDGYERGKSEVNKRVAKLTAERDAAVEDLKEISYCGNCIQCLQRDRDYIWCGAFADWFEWCDTCNEWQWRGLSLAEKTSDKEVEC